MAIPSVSGTRKDIFCVGALFNRLQPNSHQQNDAFSTSEIGLMKPSQMKSTRPFQILLLGLFVALPAFMLQAAGASSSAKKIVLIAGKKSHGPEGNRIHDYPWSVKLLKVLLDRSNVREQVRVETHFDGWPQDEHTFDDADTIVVISDGRDGTIGEEAPHFSNAARTAIIERQMKRGCGFVTFHFSTFASEANRRQILEWSGGYFQWETEGLRKWYSAIKVQDAELALPTPGHAIARGVAPFRLKEEFYYNLRFDPNDKALVPLLAVPDLPGRDPDGRWVAWARERADNGRGFGTSCGHFYDNWKSDGFRKLMLNAIAWSAHVEVPAKGVESPYVEREEINAAVGIIHERGKLDAAKGLKDNLKGLDWVQKELRQPGLSGPPPQEPAPPAKV